MTQDDSRLTQSTLAVALASRGHTAGPTVLPPEWSLPRRPHIAVPDRRASEAPDQMSDEADPVTLAYELVRQVPGIAVHRARDDSMADAGVIAGDSVLVQACTTVGDGELAMVRRRGEGTPSLRRVFIEGTCCRLVPEDGHASPVTVPRESIEIEGRVIAIVRQRLAPRLVRAGA